MPGRQKTHIDCQVSPRKTKSQTVPGTPDVKESPPPRLTRGQQKQLSTGSCVATDPHIISFGSSAVIFVYQPATTKHTLVLRSSALLALSLVW